MSQDNPTRAYIIDPKTEVITRFYSLDTLRCSAPGMTIAGENHDIVVHGYCGDNTVKKIVRMYGGSYHWDVSSDIKLRYASRYHIATVEEEKFRHLLNC